MSSEPHASWTFVTNHTQVLLCIARDEDVRLRDVAQSVGITERAAQRIVADLVAAGYVRAYSGRPSQSLCDQRQGRDATRSAARSSDWRFARAPEAGRTRRNLVENPAVASPFGQWRAERLSHPWRSNSKRRPITCDSPRVEETTSPTLQPGSGASQGLDRAARCSPFRRRP